MKNLLEAFAIEGSESFGVYDIYYEGMDAVSNFIKNEEELKHYEKFLDAFCELMYEVYDKKIPVQKIDLQKEILRTKEKFKGKKIISLDANLKGDYNISIARVWKIKDKQLDEIGYDVRPIKGGSLSLKEQLKVIPKGKYVLIDDDTATGGTIKYIKDNLPKGVEIEQTYLFLETDVNYKSYLAMYLKDFLFGAVEAGLVVKLPTGENVRVPYCYPYTNRVAIPRHKPHEFALKLLELNKNFFEGLNRQIKLKDADYAVVRAMLYLGFGEEDSMLDIINWNIKSLREAGIKEN